MQATVYTSEEICAVVSQLQKTLYTRYCSDTAVITRESRLRTCQVEVYILFQCSLKEATRILFQ